MVEVKQSINHCQVIGTLAEMNIEATTEEVVLKGSNGTEKRVTCQRIGKKEFKNPMFVIESNGNMVEVDFFPIAEKKLDENGNIVDNPRFKSMQTVLENYIPKSVNSENATRVKVDGSLRENSYVDKNTFDFKAFPQFNGFAITSSNVSDEDTTDSEISGVIRSISQEVRGENAEETGRLKVELYSFDYNGATTPFTFIVDEDLADDFTSFYENGQSVKLYYEIVTKTVGSKKATSGGFGRRDSKMVSGYTVTEYSIFRGDDPFEEENDYYVDIETVKKAKAERDIMIETKIKEQKEKGNDVGKKPSPSKAKAKSNPFGGTSDNSSSAEADDCPF